jgi:hypothetical protein
LDIPPGFGYGTGVVNGNIKGDLTGLNEVDDVARWIVLHGYSQRLETLAFELFKGVHHFWHLRNTRNAARSPKINERDLAFEIRCLLGASIEQNESTVWGDRLGLPKQSGPNQ